jgi:hypothetical protein
MGYAEAQNVAFRWAEEKRGRLPQLAADLVAAEAAVIVASDGPGTAALRWQQRKRSRSYQSGRDSVLDGLVASMSRPGGNVAVVTRWAKSVVWLDVCAQGSVGRCVPVCSWRTNRNASGIVKAFLVSELTRTLWRYVRRRDNRPAFDLS